MSTEKTFIYSYTHSATNKTCINCKLIHVTSHVYRLLKTVGVCVLKALYIAILQGDSESFINVLNIKCFVSIFDERGLEIRGIRAI